MLVYLFHEGSQPFPLTNLPLGGEVVASDRIRNHTVDEVPLSHDRDKRLAFLVVLERRRLLSEDLLR